MFSRGILLVAAVLALFLMACGSTPGDVNNSGHEPYLSGDYPVALEAYQLAQERSSESGEPFYNSGNVLYRTGVYEGSVQDFDESLKHAQGVSCVPVGFLTEATPYFSSSNIARRSKPIRKCCG